MTGIVTDGTKEKILREEPGKIDDEVKAKSHELGLQSLIPQQSQDGYRQLKDLKDEAGHINDLMSMEREKSSKMREERRKARQKSGKEQLRMILAHQERRAREDFIGRRIVFIGGGFENYFDHIRMTPYRVLLKEIKRDDELDGIALPGIYEEDMAHYSVICACDEADGIVDAGDIVMVEKYAGTEVISGGVKYRIVFVDDIICKVEN